MKTKTLQKLQKIYEASDMWKTIEVKNYSVLSDKLTYVLERLDELEDKLDKLDKIEADVNYLTAMHDAKLPTK